MANANVAAKAKSGLTFWKTVFILIMAVGLWSTIVRFTQGLGAATNLSDKFPWGIWIGFDVMCGVGLGAGGFTMAAIVYIFNIKRFKPIIRPAILTAFLGYVLVIVALLFDIGQPHRIWHALIWWNPHSVLFEVAWCVMLYTSVLALEFSPVFFERFQLEKPLKIIKVIIVPLVIVGVLLSMLHQSSLGSLFLIVPEKLYPLWYTPLLPILFFISSIAVGFSMVIFESYLSSRAFNKQLERPLVQELARIVVFVLGLYLTLKIIDLTRRDAWSYLFMNNIEAWFFRAEWLIGVITPMILLAVPKIRKNQLALFWSVLMVVVGFLMSRLNVAITGMEGYTQANYFPSWMEISITVAAVALGFGVFRLIVKNFPVFEVTEPKMVLPKPIKVRLLKKEAA